MSHSGTASFWEYQIPTLGLCPILGRSTIDKSPTDGQITVQVTMTSHRQTDKVAQVTPLHERPIDQKSRTNHPQRSLIEGTAAMGGATDG